MIPDALPSFLKPIPRTLPDLARERPSRPPPRMPHGDVSAADAVIDEIEFDEAGGFQPAQSRTLSGIRMIGQLADNWCWSAVTETVIKFFDGGRSPSQDQIATNHITWDDSIVCKPAGETRSNLKACGAGGSCAGHCNDAHLVRVVLDENGRFDTTLTSKAPPTFADVRNEIDANRPLVCRIAWTRGGGHFVAVVGWTIDADEVERVHVLDPKRNEGGQAIAERVIAYDTFVSDYRLMGASGSVNYSYRVK